MYTHVCMLLQTKRKSQLPYTPTPPPQIFSEFKLRLTASSSEDFWAGWWRGESPEGVMRQVDKLCTHCSMTLPHYVLRHVIQFFFCFFANCYCVPIVKEWRKCSQLNALNFKRKKRMKLTMQSALSLKQIRFIKESY